MNIIDKLLMQVLEKFFSTQLTLCVNNTTACQTALDWLKCVVAIGDSDVSKCIGQYEKVKDGVSNIFEQSKMIFGLSDKNCWAASILMLKLYHNQNILSLRDAYLQQAEAWFGKKEEDGSYDIILEMYNSSLSESMNIWKREYGAIEYDGQWCACFTSAVAIACGAQHIVPIGTSCTYHLKKLTTNSEQAGFLDIWKKPKVKEEDSTEVMIMPEKGWLILYDRYKYVKKKDENGNVMRDEKGEVIREEKEGHDGNPEHVGIVFEQMGNVEFKTIEGNTYVEKTNLRERVASHILNTTNKKHQESIHGYIAPKWENALYMYKNESILLEQLTDPQKQGMKGLCTLLQNESSRRKIAEKTRKGLDQRITRLCVLSEQIIKHKSVKEWERNNQSIGNLKPAEKQKVMENFESQIPKKIKDLAFKDIQDWFTDKRDLQIISVDSEKEWTLTYFTSVLPAIIAMPAEINQCSSDSDLDKLIKQNKGNSTALHAVLFYGIYLQEREIWCSFVNATNGKHGSIKWSTLKEWLVGNNVCTDTNSSPKFLFITQNITNQEQYNERQ